MGCISLCGKVDIEYMRIQDSRIADGFQPQLRPEELRVVAWENDLDF